MDYLYVPIRNVNAYEEKQYLSRIQREAFQKADKAALFEELVKHKFQGRADYFVIHVPFDREEHELVIRYLAMMKLVRNVEFYHNLPIQLLKRLPNRSQSDVMKYIGDMIERQSSAFDSEDNEIRVYNPLKYNFQTIKINRTINMSPQISQIKSMACNNSTLLLIPEKQEPYIIFLSPTGYAKERKLVNAEQNTIFPINNFAFNDKVVNMVSRSNYIVFDLTKPGTLKGIHNVETFKSTIFKHQQSIAAIEKCKASVMFPDAFVYATTFVSYITKDMLSFRLYESVVKDIFPTKSGKIILISDKCDVYVFDEIIREMISYGIRGYKENTKYECMYSQPNDVQYIPCNGEALVFAEENHITVIPFEAFDCEKKQDFLNTIYEFDAPNLISYPAYIDGNFACLCEKSMLVWSFKLRKKPIKTAYTRKNRSLIFPINIPGHPNFVIVSDDSINIYDVNEQFIPLKYKLPETPNLKQTTVLADSGVFVTIFKGSRKPFAAFLYK